MQKTHTFKAVCTRRLIRIWYQVISGYYPSENFKHKLSNKVQPHPERAFRKEKGMCFENII